MKTKTIQWFVHWLYIGRTKTKTPEPPAPENAAPSLVQAAPVPKPEPFTDDDSPPGFKIRWHF